MTPWQWIIIGYATLFCGIWIVGYLRATWTMLHTDRLWTTSSPPPKRWPKLSVIAAACNEGATIRKALTSLLACDYPNLEIIIVNDRSTDDTGAILADVASQDDRVTPLQISELPMGWLGKNHALHVACQEANGEWLLFTDADVHFQTDALKKGIAFVLQEEADHLTMCPNMVAKSFSLRIVIHAFAMAFMQNLRIEKLKTPNTSAFAGSGSFNLVSRAALDRTPGFEWLRMDVVDDVGLGLMLRDSGATTRFAMAGPAVEVEWYPSLGAMFKGLTKNAFGAAGHYSILRMSAIILLGLVFVPAPFVALSYAFVSSELTHGFSILLLSLGFSAFGAFVIGVLSLRRCNPWGSLWVSLFIPVGALLLVMIAGYSMFVCVRDDGVTWRGTHYGLDELRKNQRLKL